MNLWKKNTIIALAWLWLIGSWLLRLLGSYLQSLTLQSKSAIQQLHNQQAIMRESALQEQLKAQELYAESNRLLEEARAINSGATYLLRQADELHKGIKAQEMVEVLSGDFILLLPQE